MRSHALSALSLVVLAASTTAASQLHERQQTDCLDDILSLVGSMPTVPSALDAAPADCIPATLSAVAASYTSEGRAWYTSIVNAISACPAYPTASIPTLPLSTEIPLCTGEQTSGGAATATLSSTSSNAVATNTNPTKASTTSQSKATTTSAPHSSAASGSATRGATTSASPSANAAARETGAIFAAVAVAALGAAAL